ncbi:MAG: DUF6431 domain-containing protein [Lachnospira sp.]|nr:DUF6431 domain-containing protein [Lachnospira sp.]
MKCDRCGHKMRHRDYVKRIVKSKGGVSRDIQIQRLYCKNCNHIKRELPSYLLAYKHYESEIIKGVIDGSITSNDIEYEDYPCEKTMERWRSQKLQGI